MNDIVIFNISIANDLIDMGFPVKRIRYNNDIENRVVILFQNTEEIKRVLRERYDITID